MDGSMSTMALLTSLGPTALKTLGGLGLLLLGGRFVLRRIFEIVAQARSDETFVALCLLTVTGASLCTQRLGFSDTLGAFCAGVLLAETNYRTQVVRNPAQCGLPKNLSSLLKNSHNFVRNLCKLLLMSSARRPSSSSRKILICQFHHLSCTCEMSAATRHTNMQNVQIKLDLLSSYH